MRIKRLRDEGCFAEPRHADDPDFGRIDLQFRMLGKEIDQLADAPSPGPQRGPIVRFARLTVIRESDDAGSEVVVV